MKRKNENAFTLIELLAVIVILAIIALIATPIILGIVEDARKDAFLRSVELVVSTTDMDIGTKPYEKEYVYTIEDGTISNLEIPVKNTEGMNGRIIYNEEGNDVYAIHNGKWCVKKTQEMTRAEINDYVSEDCIILGEKESFLRNVELVVEATGIDVISKLTDAGHEYELLDGMILDTEPSITYEIADKDACKNAVIGMGIPTDYATPVCNNEPFFSGVSLTEYVTNNPGIVSTFIEAGAVKEVYNYNDLNLVENTAGMNGTISYNADSKEVYAIHNETYCVIKKNNMDKAEVSDYVEGECNANVTMPFQEFINASVGGDKVISGDGQLINLGKYGIRYQGFNPNNYVYFNCSDYSNQTSESCELWRIIGIVDGKVKLIKNESIGNMPWDDPNDNGSKDGDETSNWNDSTLKLYLNGTNGGDYYASLTETSKTFISPSTWYLRGFRYTQDVTKAMMYDLERTTGTVLYEMEKIDNVNIGVMYPSDWGFSAMENDVCSKNTSLQLYSACKQSNWIAQGLSSEYEWLIMPETDYTYGAFRGVSDGKVFDGSQVYHFYAVRPVLYLTSNVEIGIGDGSFEKPYQLSLQ